MPSQYRRCSTCGATSLGPPAPSTVVPCACGGEMPVAPVTADALLAERKRCAVALFALAAKCESSADKDGDVSAAGAARHMRTLAEWFLL